MQSPLKGVPLATRHLVVGFLASVALGGALAAPAPQPGNNAPGNNAPGNNAPSQEANEAAAKKPGANKHKHSHAHRPLPKAPLGQERVPSRPLPPLPAQR